MLQSPSDSQQKSRRQDNECTTEQVYVSDTAADHDGVNRSPVAPHQTSDNTNKENDDALLSSEGDHRGEESYPHVSPYDNMPTEGEALEHMLVAKFDIDGNSGNVDTGASPTEAQGAPSSSSNPPSASQENAVGSREIVARGPTADTSNNYDRDDDDQDIYSADDMQRSTGRNGKGSANGPKTSRRPEDDTVLVKGEADLKLVGRIIAQFDAIRQEIQLPILDAMLLEKYIIEPLDEAVEKCKKYYAKRRQAAEQLCEDMPLIAAAVAGGGLEPSVEREAAAGKAEGLQGELTVEEFCTEIDLSVGKPPIPLARRRVVGHFVKLLNLLTDHKQATLDVLEAIGRREEALEGTMQIAAANESGDLHDVETALLIHKSLFEVQKASLMVVDRIRKWRDGLCMPHPFAVASGENYILKMFGDCKMLSEHVVVQKMLPMQDLFCDFPLFSNVPSISRYMVEREAVRGPFSPVGAPPLDLRLHQRLKDAEAYMHTEIELQLAMVRALLEMVTTRSEFLPIVDISPICPPLKKQREEAAERLNKAEGKLKPLRVCVPLGASTAPSEPAGNPTAVSVDPNSTVGKVVLKYIRGIRVASLDMRERYEQTLISYFESLKTPPTREEYDAVCKENHRRGVAEKTFKAMRTKSNTVESARRRYTVTLGSPETMTSPTSGDGLLGKN